MPEYDDAALEQMLRRTLVDRLGAMPLDLTVEGVEARARAAARKRADRRRFVVLGLAAALLMPVGWLLAGAPRPDFPPADGYQILVTRWQRSETEPGAVDALDVVAIRGDGEERLVRRLRQEDMPQGFRLGAAAMVSKDGWLAVSHPDGIRWALVDLRDETAQIRTIDVTTGNPPIGWGPDGRFAWIDTTGLNVIDPSTGVTETDATAWPPDQTDVSWTADGSGFIAALGTPLRVFYDQPGSVLWRTQTLGSGQVGQSFVPVYQASGSRTYSLAGDRFVVCPGPVHGMGMCPGDGRAFVIRQDVAGGVTQWDVTDAAGAPVRAGFAAKDRGMWVVSQDYPGDNDGYTDRFRPGQVILERLDEQGRVRQTLGAALGEGFSDPNLDAMSPDDSLARIGTMPEDPDTLSWILVPTDGSPATYHVGDFAGFISASTAEGLPGAAFQPVAGVTAPLVGQAKELVSAETLERYADATIGIGLDDRVVLRASSTDPGSASRPLTVTIAPGHRIGMQIACSGHGTLEVSVADNGFGAECMADDQSSYGYTVDNVDGPDLPVQVDATSGASWRIVVFDIRPPGTF